MQSRRRLLGILGAGFSSTFLGPRSAFSRKSSVSRLSAGTNDSEPWWLLAPLQAGSPLQDGWTVEHLGTISNGASVLTLGHQIRGSVRVHICLYTNSPKGFAYSELFDLIVMDHGAGRRAVPKNLSPTLKLLEITIRNNEFNGLTKVNMDGVSQMMTHIERVDAFGCRSLG